MYRFLSLAVSAVMGFTPLATANEMDLAGHMSVQWQSYQSDGAYEGQSFQQQASLAVEPDFYWQWESGDSLTFTPFAMYDQKDAERRHVDIRELMWISPREQLEWRVGIGKVFWGVTEFQHLVDIVNQTDLVADFDGEEKLGQPMVSASFMSDWGVIDTYLLTGFRERTFPGRQGRLRGPLPIEVDGAEYESSAKQRHIDLAVRWSHSVDVYDIGFYWFKGTGRDPLFLNKEGEDLSPYYEQIDQLGLDFQATVDSWLWKLEAKHTKGQFEEFMAFQTGFEYTLYGVFRSASDVGLLFEYGYENRGAETQSTFQNDVFGGLRVTLNDTASTEVLIGGSYDVDFGTKGFSVEGSHRINDQLKLVIDARYFGDDDQDPAAVIAKDDYVRLTLEYYL